ncbi:hypothetical protein Xen7305DRAFT_00004470 [Xenococcus sp. PCC 7305]|nr:hypothetical protein Xen7305DRAFT_00004470 [Xenococcus sp. PCC 7305]
MKHLKPISIKNFVKLVTEKIVLFLHIETPIFTIDESHFFTLYYLWQ